MEARLTEMGFSFFYKVEIYERTGDESGERVT